ncbi:MAG: hypothetical protein R3D01_06785 [Hyphomicrobiales bacterium]
MTRHLRHDRFDAKAATYCGIELEDLVSGDEVFQRIVDPGSSEAVEDDAGLRAIHSGSRAISSSMVSRSIAADLLGATR